jgi:Flp pilus assembly protein TadD
MKDSSWAARFLDNKDWIWYRIAEDHMQGKVSMPGRLGSWVIIGCVCLTGCATPATHVEQGRAFQSEGRPDDAIAAYYQALQDEPRNLEVQLGLSEALAAKGLWADSLHALERAHDLSPQDEALTRRLGEAYFAQGQRLRTAGKVSDAYAAWEKTLIYIPGHAEATAELAKLYNIPDQKSPAAPAPSLPASAGATPTATTTIAAAPAAPAASTSPPANVPAGDAEAHRNSGMQYFKQGKNEQALAEFQLVVRLEPNDAKTFNNLGNVYLKMSRMDDAHTAFERSVTLDPNQSVTHGNWGTVYFQQGRYPRAREEWETALKLDSKNETARQNLEILDNLGY